MDDTLDDALVEVWAGDMFVDIMTYKEFLILKEEEAWVTFRWCPGHGP